MVRPARQSRLEATRFDYVAKQCGFPGAALREFLVTRLKSLTVQQESVMRKVYQGPSIRYIADMDLPQILGFFERLEYTELETVLGRKASRQLWTILTAHYDMLKKREPQISAERAKRIVKETYEAREAASQGDLSKFAEQFNARGTISA